MIRNALPGAQVFPGLEVPEVTAASFSVDLGTPGRWPVLVLTVRSPSGSS